jgi:SecY
MVSAAEQLASNLNFGAFAKAEELKKRLWFTLAALVVYRLGTYIPIPGINPAAFAESFKAQSSGILGMFNMFSGGAVGRMAIFALNIMPYISASIIMQLMTSVVPTLEQLKKEGEQGRKQINQYTRYMTVALAAFQAYGIAFGLEGCVPLAAKAQLLGRDPADLCLFPAALADHGGAVQPGRRARMAERARRLARTRAMAAHRHLRGADRVLRLLLHGNRLQPTGDGRQSAKVRRLPAGHPPGGPYRGVHRLRADAHHRCRRDLPLGRVRAAWVATVVL